MKLSKVSKRFLILDSLYSDSNVSQRNLATDTGISLGQTNVIIKKLYDEGLLKQEVVSKKRIRYLLTEQGLLERNRLSCDRIFFILHEYKNIKKAVTELLHRLYDKGFREFVIDNELGDLNELIREAFNLHFSQKAVLVNETTDEREGQILLGANGGGSGGGNGGGEKDGTRKHSVNILNELTI